MTIFNSYFNWRFYMLMEIHHGSQVVGTALELQLFTSCCKALCCTRPGLGSWMYLKGLV